MKRKILIITISIVAVLFLGGISFFLISRDAMLIRNPVVLQQRALITYAAGECLYQGTEDEWLPVEIGQKIRVGDTLKTMEDGELDIRFSENTLMRMDSDTTLVINENTLKNLSVDLDKGRLFAKFHKLFNDQKFNVRSGNAVAGVRGTDLVFEAYPERTDIYALSGITEIHNRKLEENRILLAFQKKTTVLRDNPPTQPVTMEQEQIQRFQQVINLIHSEKVFLITNNIQFKANTAEILPSSYKELAIVLDALETRSFKMEIAGHTANVGSSSAMYDLSLLRARAIKEYFVEQGVSPERMTIRGYGGSKPLADNGTPEGMALNRRVEFIILD